MSAQECELCPKGRFGSNTGLLNRGQCTRCKPGRLAMTSGVDECKEHRKCLAGEYTKVAGNATAHPVCGGCPLGRFRATPATSSIAPEVATTVCAFPKLPFMYYTTADGKGEVLNPVFAIITSLVVLLVLVATCYWPVSKLVYLIKHKPPKRQTKKEELLARTFVLPKSAPELKSNIQALAYYEGKLPGGEGIEAEWTEEDISNIEHHQDQVLWYLSQRMETLKRHDLRVMKLCLEMEEMNNFKTLYRVTMENIAVKQRDGYDKCIAVAQIAKRRNSIRGIKCPDNQRRLVNLYRTGREVYDRFHAFIERAAKVSATADVYKHNGKRATMKGMYRVIEKALFKYNSEWNGGEIDLSQVRDVVRGGISDKSMSGLARIAQFILDSNQVTVCRVKNRFANPSTQEWTDLMLNFYLNDDPWRHVCEVQLIHFKMLSQRVHNEGHGAYNIYRAASELSTFYQAKSRGNFLDKLVSGKLDRTMGELPPIPRAPTSKPARRLVEKTENMMPRGVRLSRQPSAPDINNNSLEPTVLWKREEKSAAKAPQLPRVVDETKQKSSSPRTQFVNGIDHAGDSFHARKQNKYVCVCVCVCIANVTVGVAVSNDRNETAETPTDDEAVYR